ncbi:syntaxin-binding protein 4-like, partial [Tachysurus ichikawai]
MPKIHPETKVLIIKSLKTRSTADVADTFNVSQGQVQRIKKRFEETGDVLDKPRSGRPRKTTAREDRLLAQKSKASTFSTAAELHETWSPEVPVSTRTVCQILSRNGIHDESSLELHHSRRKYCRRPTGARMDPRFTQKTVKFGGGKIMVWGCIQYGGVREICRVEGNINSLKYQEILATSYIPNHKRGQILQQDGAPSHTSISTSKFLMVKKIKMFQDCPAQSLDMNIIEHMWGRMKEEAWKTKPKNIDEL